MFRWLVLGAAVLLAATLGLFLVPMVSGAVVAGRVQQVADLAAAWDVPPVVVLPFQAAAAAQGIPWFLLAGTASTATDFARHAPDGVERGTAPGTSVFPVVTPPILGQGQGMFLAVPSTSTDNLADPQDVAATASWLATALASRAPPTSLVMGDLTDPAVQQYWQAVLTTVPVAIQVPASRAGPGVAGSPGSNPIQQFGQAVLEDIAAPVTATNLGAFSAWAAGESTCAHFNPLATTQPEPGATAFNNLSGGGHVWNYPSFATGVRATVTAMENGRYQPVLAALRADAGISAVAAAVESSPWGTGHFGSPSYAGLACSNDGPDGSASPTPPTLSGPSAVAATIVARAAWYQQIYEQLSQLDPNAGPAGSGH